MTLEEIRERVQRIRDVSGDDESAHSCEDELRADFIKHVMDCPTDPCLAEKANLVLQTDLIEFSRWYA